MTPTQRRAALRLADAVMHPEAAALLRELLAATDAENATVEPVAWWCKHPLEKGGGGFMTCDELAAQHYMHKFRTVENGPVLVPLYAAPQQQAKPAQEPVAWHVCSVNKDGSLSLEFAAPWKELAHEHINDAINEHDIDGATSWVVRPVYTSPQPQRTEPSQDTPPQRPPTPTGWSDTDWIAHLATMPPIAYAVRDTLYGTSKAGVLRFCAADEPGAFAVYVSPQQRKPLTDEQIRQIVVEASTGSAIKRDGSTSMRIARAIEEAVWKNI